MNFNNKLVVITGGASGIGQACARLFAEGAGRVVIADKRADVAEEAAHAIGCDAIGLDVGDSDAIETVANLIETKFGPVSILVNSAEILQRTLPPEQLEIAEWDRVQKINLRGTYLCCRAFGTFMAARRSGVLVNIASVSGMHSGPLHSYGPAKAGVIHLTECLAAEWGPQGVRVNAVSPGFTQTPALQRGVEHKVLNTDILSKWTALGRLVRSDEIASAVAFLASDAASAITGINLPVDAGYLVTTPWASFGGLRNTNPDEIDG